eukprot:TRINITY_DN2286_c0_g1_i1.p1 TRINITY_DN2286_c0_g1~~TRINITY_DN2286_c0_g1_i1.p1  ORF type:complete len:145 (-),score=5.54 TRINITY_DN2286_c0_g1_i1:79-513(-)
MLGVTVIELFAIPDYPFEYPGKGMPIVQHLMRLTSDDFQLDPPQKNFPEILYKFSQRCCQIDPKARPHVSDLCDYLKSEYDSEVQTKMNDVNGLRTEIFQLRRRIKEASRIEDFETCLLLEQSIACLEKRIMLIETNWKLCVHS